MTDETNGTGAELVERIAEAIKGTLAGHLGCEVLGVSDGEARGRLRIERKHLHPGGYVATGTVCTLAESVAAWATVPLLEAGEGFSTIEFKTNFFTPVHDGILIAEARALHRGPRTIVLESRVIDHESRLVALMLVTQGVIDAPAGATGG
jgi:1,4-dihydroxy-2-naphthoyl-CoA hydrolase